MTTRDSRVAVLGAGKMGEALLSGLLRAGRPAEDLVVTTRWPARADTLRQRYGVRSLTNAEAAAESTTLVLAVKPQDMTALLDELADVVTAGTLVVSMAAGIPTAAIERRLAAGVPVVRVMSNTPVLVDEAMSVMSAGAHAGPEHLAQAEALLSPVGKVLRVPESQQDAVTALSGSGPAYFFFLVEAMIDAGILLGLPRAVAVELLVQTAVGAAVMLRDTGEHPVTLRENVTSPGGTTINAIRELERHGVRAALIAAIEAAHDRSRELAAESAAQSSEAEESGPV
ncbi:MAG: pyrroline-5-carboxylate reductase [Mycobacteriales bacterium]